MMSGIRRICLKPGMRAASCAWLAVCAFAVVAASAAQASGAEPSDTEPSGTAAPRFGPADYIVRFVQYVRWPADDESAAWRICVTHNLADASAGYSGQRARGREFTVLLADAPAAVSNCQVLDLTGLALADARPFLDAARPAAVLTVGDGAAFCSAGGVVCLDPAGDSASPAFEINLTAVRRSGLLVNARLMKLGQRRAPGALP